MQKFDLLIIGGGMVGLTLALATRKLTDLSVAIVDSQPTQPLDSEPELRVSAINAASQNIFQQLDVWQDMLDSRGQAYHQMHVWDKAGYGKLNFTDERLDAEQLGFILENKVVRNALWQKAEQDAGISLFTEEKITNLAFGDTEVFAAFSQQPPITAKLVVGADGANSWLRQQLDVGMAFRDYNHHAMVATVKCSQGHQDTAWQVFLPTGPLAFLPLYQHTEHGQQLCSIVWSSAPEDVARLKQLSREQFNREITAASDGKLGTVELISELQSYPLTMRLAHDFYYKKAVLIGDAAHTIHPLAGQGVNLGLIDAVALAETLAELNSSGRAITDEAALKAYARWRKSDASEMIAAMEAIKQVFASRTDAIDTPLQVLRGIGMSLIDVATPVKDGLIKQALGYKGKMPSLAKAQR